MIKKEILQSLRSIRMTREELADERRVAGPQPIGLPPPQLLNKNVAKKTLLQICSADFKDKLNYYLRVSAKISVLFNSKI